MNVWRGGGRGEGAHVPTHQTPACPPACLPCPPATAPPTAPTAHCPLPHMHRCAPSARRWASASWGWGLTPSGSTRTCPRCPRPGACAGAWVCVGGVLPIFEWWVLSPVRPPTWSHRLHLPQSHPIAPFTLPVPPHTLHPAPPRRRTGMASCATTCPRGAPWVAHRHCAAGAALRGGAGGMRLLRGGGGGRLRGLLRARIAAAAGVAGAVGLQSTQGNECFAQ